VVLVTQALCESGTIQKAFDLFVTANITEPSFSHAVAAPTGRAGCPEYARAELLADYLQTNLPAFRVHKVVQHPDRWEVRTADSAVGAQHSAGKERTHLSWILLSCISIWVGEHRRCRTFGYECQPEEKFECCESGVLVNLTTGYGHKMRAM